jgi:hypothetical protein
LKYYGNKKKQVGNGQRTSGIEEDCIGSQGSQGCVVLEKRQIYKGLYTTTPSPVGRIFHFLNTFWQITGVVQVIEFRSHKYFVCLGKIH